MPHLDGCGVFDLLFPAVLRGIADPAGDLDGVGHAVVVLQIIGQIGSACAQGHGALRDLLSVDGPDALTDLAGLRRGDRGGDVKGLPGGQVLRRGELDVRVRQAQVGEGLQIQGGGAGGSAGLAVVIDVGQFVAQLGVLLQVVAVRDFDVRDRVAAAQNDGLLLDLYVIEVPDARTDLPLVALRDREAGRGFQMLSGGKRGGSLDADAYTAQVVAGPLVHGIGADLQIGVAGEKICDSHRAGTGDGVVPGLDPQILCFAVDEQRVVIAGDDDLACGAAHVIQSDGIVAAGDKQRLRFVVDRHGPAVAGDLHRGEGTADGDVAAAAAHDKGRDPEAVRDG